MNLQQIEIALCDAGVLFYCLNGSLVVEEGIHISFRKDGKALVEGLWQPDIAGVECANPSAVTKEVRRLITERASKVHK